MKYFVLALMAFSLMGGALLPETADAKRFGGGKSFGKQYSTPRQATPPGQSANQSAARQQQAAAGQQAPRSGASRWLGPLAGLAAGGLLASMFFGDGFEGFQIMDFLLIAALIFGGVMLFRMLRNRASAGGGAPAAVGAGAGHYGGATTPAGGLGGLSAGTAGAGREAPSTSAGGAEEAPAWFDSAGFVEGAKTHFIRLQAAWDSSDFRDIREYTAPQLFAEIKREREAMGDAPNYTEVVTLKAELISVRRDADQVVASVHFSGLIREEDNGAAKPLDEIWHVAHDWDNAEGDWLITGIQQTGG
ncbi:MAG: 39S ribosomal protein L45 [Thiohalocapsa sp.]|nr:39S ribosomal protein L45 [Thiohalocapsa sp.]